jgi:ABC-type branched-subunit amino acid transport system ATPase component
VVAAQDAPPDLEVRSVSKGIGGLKIVREASFTVRGGTVHGFIGPNGSGKTTLLNCISGLTAVDAGEVRYGDRALPPHAAQRARAGLARTFQTVLLIEHATVADNLLVGVDAHRRVPHLVYGLGLPPALRERRQSAVEVARWAEALGLGAVLDRPVSSLTPRERRLVEIGRALATHPGIVLMDEPVAGLAGAEIDELTSVIRLLRSRGVTVVLVEHHAELVMELCDAVTVIDVGEIVTTDVPAKVAVDPRVVAAYLGDELVAQAVPGPVGS